MTSAAVVLLLFAIALGLQWSGAGSIVVADTQAYIVGGVNLVRHGAFTNAFGETELWFPPLFPILIGVSSFGGRIDPFLAGRVIAALATLATLLVVWRLGCSMLRSRWAAVFAVVVLACNPLFQQHGVQSLSQALATLLATVALLVWLRLGGDRPLARAAWLGLTIGLGYLARPEVSVLLVLFAAIDSVERRQEWRRLCLQYAVAAALFAICAAPYVLYLRVQTGRFTLSNKGEVNLAAGRAEYYNLPREFIDPATLRMGYWEYPKSAGAEMERFVHNIVKIGKAYGSIVRLPIGVPVLLLAVCGAVALLRSDRRIALGVLAQFGYLPLLARYAVAPAYLHATLPAIALLAGTGFLWVERELFSVTSSRHAAARRALVAVFCVWIGLSLVEQGTRQPRWALTQTVPDAILKQAGLRLRDAGRTGTVLELGGTISYYSGLTRARLTRNDLATLRAYAARSHTGPVYLALATIHRQSYHPTVAALLDSPGDMPVVESTVAGDARVLVLQLQ